MKAERSSRSMHLSCADCGAGLPPPDAAGASACFYCGTTHLSDRPSEVLPVAPESERPTRDRESMHDGEDAARIPMTEDAVLRLCRQHFGESEPIFLCPHIPARKEQ